MKNWFFILFLGLSFCGYSHSRSNWTSSEAERSDTIDIKSYTITLDWTAGQLIGECRIKYQAKLDGVNWINLDLLKLNVDSVFHKTGSTLNYTYNDSILFVKTPMLNTGDSSEIVVYYHGTPWHEQWGGWHVQNGYSFNLGVGFQSIPHNLGKVWHPCFDNFVERALYEVTIISPNFPVGSGMLVSSVIGGGAMTNTWKLNQEIPTYLYGIAISDYSQILDTIDGVYGKMPVEIYAKPQNVTTVKNGFRNLDSIYISFEEKFGPYYWDKVGYSMTALGAMEHATNIALPITAISDEGIIAHELSHHWWGDLITCETDRDMWINEGMAVFSEYIYLERLYGEYAMNREKESNLYQVVKYAHLEENGYQPISGVPRVDTYGRHSYRKGSLVGHNMRRYLGDSLFFAGVKSFLSTNKFSAVNSYDFRDHMTNSTGVDMTDFFDEWVFNPGMPDYQIWNWESEATPGLNNVNVTLKQNKAGSNNLYTQIPVTIRFWSSRNNYWDEVVTVSKASEKFSFQFPVAPIFVELNPNNEIAYAMTSFTDTLWTTGTVNTQLTDLNVSAINVTDTVMIRTECHWTSPYISIENQVDLGVRVNPNRYWKFSGIGLENADLGAGSAFNAGVNKGDEGLIKYSEDSLVLLYRPIGGEWVSLGDHSIIKGAPGDKRGAVSIDSLKAGEYVLAEKDSTINESLLSTKSLTHEKGIKVFPNPAKNHLTIVPGHNMGKTEITILDLSGREKAHFTQQNFGSQIELDLSSYKDGVYFYILSNSSSTYSGRFIKGGYSK
ncbi:MAG: M1 family aminopeptidase [Salibacteraceae bacterium]